MPKGTMSQSHQSFAGTVENTIERHRTCGCGRDSRAYLPVTMVGADCVAAVAPFLATEKDR